MYVGSVKLYKNKLTLQQEVHNILLFFNSAQGVTNLKVRCVQGWSKVCSRMKLLQLVDQGLVNPRGKLFSFSEQYVYGQLKQKQNSLTWVLECWIHIEIKTALFFER